jgi:hypothetical protein
MLVIPTKAVPSQSLGVVLAQQPCTINVYQTGQFDYEGIYVDLYVNNALVIGGALGLIGVRIVRSVYLGFIGDLAFFDENLQNPTVRPDYTGLGGRYFLAYLEASDSALAPLV